MTKRQEGYILIVDSTKGLPRKSGVGSHPTLVINTLTKDDSPTELLSKVWLALTDKGLYE